MQPSCSSSGTAWLLLTPNTHVDGMVCFPVFYSSLPDIGAGFRSVEAEDSYEAEQIVQREYPGAITASLSENMTDEKEVRRLFVEWLKTL